MFFIIEIYCVIHHCSDLSSPMLKYACPVWHSSLTAMQTKALESLQCASMKTATTLCHWSEPDSSRWSHGVKNWPSASSSTVCCKRRRASIICCRTSVTSLSQADNAKQEHSNL